MNAERLFAEFDRLGEAPDAVSLLRCFILDLAVRGKLVEQVPTDEPASAVIRLSSPQVPRRRRQTPAPRGDDPDRGHTAGFGTPDSWEWLRLGEIAEVSYGFAFESSRFNSARVGLPLIRIRDISNADTEAYYDGPFDPSYIVKAGDYLVGMDGNFNVRKWCGPDALLNQRVMRIRNWSEGVVADFIAVSLQMILNRLHSGTSQTTVKHLSAKQVNTIYLPVPPLAEQRRIVAKVDELIALCDQLNAAQIEREDRRVRLRSVSLTKLREADARERRSEAEFFRARSHQIIRHSSDLSDVRGTILDLALKGAFGGSRPETWREYTLGALGKWGSGGTPNRGRAEYFGGSIPWVVIGDLNGGYVTQSAERITDLGLQNSSAKLVKPGTLLIGMYGASVGKLGIAGVTCATNQAIAHCEPDTSLADPDYLFLLLQHLRPALIERGRGGAQPNISQAILKSWTVSLPTVEEQRNTVKKVNEFMGVCDSMEESLRLVEEGRTRLLDAILHHVLDEVGVAGGPTEAALAAT